MADKSFGVKDINLIGASGTPTIESPNNLNINAVNVAISTDITVAGKVSLGAGTSISSPGTNVLTLGTNSVERVRVTSDGRIGIATDDPNSMGRVSIVVPSTGGHGAINIQNHEQGSGKTNIVMRSLDNNGGNWADAEFRSEGYSFKIRTTERFRIDFDGQATFDKGAPGSANQVISRFQAESSRQLDVVWHDTGSLMGFDTPSNHGYIFKTNGTERLRITSAGEVTKPSQPAFRSGRSSSYSPGASSDIIFDSVSGAGRHNVGNHYNTSNGRFTAPVAGVYTFTAHVIWENLVSGQNMADCFVIMVNGSVWGYSGRRGEYINGETGNNGYYADFMTYQLSLAANDYVTINNQFNLQVHGNAAYSTFSGHLVC